MNKQLRIYESPIFELRIKTLPVGSFAQLIERCTGIAEVMGSNPVQA